MPERYPVQPPTQTNAKQNVIAGTNTFSGTPNTGQVLFTQGGSVHDSRHSGNSPGDITLWTGAGRLDSVSMLGYGAAAPAAASGVPIYFYDAAAAVSGGPTAHSGLKVLAIVDARAVAARDFGNTIWNSGARMFSSPVPFPPATFTSGLCVTSFSGQPGWAADYTPVVSA